MKRSAEFYDGKSIPEDMPFGKCFLYSARAAADLNHCTCSLNRVYVLVPRAKVQSIPKTGLEILFGVYRLS